MNRRTFISALLAAPAAMVSGKLPASPATAIGVDLAAKDISFFIGGPIGAIRGCPIGYSAGGMLGPQLCKPDDGIVGVKRIWKDEKALAAIG